MKFKLIVILLIIFSFFSFFANNPMGANKVIIEYVKISTDKDICTTDYIQVSAKLKIFSNPFTTASIREIVDSKGTVYAKFYISLYNDKNKALVSNVCYTHILYNDSYNMYTVELKKDNNSSEATNISKFIKYFDIDYYSAESFFTNLTSAPIYIDLSKYVDKNNQIKLYAKCYAEIYTTGIVNVKSKTTFKTDTKKSEVVTIKLHPNPIPHLECELPKNKFKVGDIVKFKFTITNKSDKYDAYGKNVYVTISYSDGLEFISASKLKGKDMDITGYKKGDKIWKAFDYVNPYFFNDDYYADVFMEAKFNLLDFYYGYNWYGGNNPSTSSYIVTFKAVESGNQWIQVHHTVNTGWININSSYHPFQRTLYFNGDTKDQQGWSAKKYKIIIEE